MYDKVFSFCYCPVFKCCTGEAGEPGQNDSKSMLCTALTHWAGHTMAVPCHAVGFTKIKTYIFSKLKMWPTHWKCEWIAITPSGMTPVNHLLCYVEGLRWKKCIRRYFSLEHAERIGLCYRSGFRSFFGYLLIFFFTVPLLKIHCYQQEFWPKQKRNH